MYIKDLIIETFLTYIIDSIICFFCETNIKKKKKMEEKKKERKKINTRNLKFHNCCYDKISSRRIVGCSLDIQFIW